ncbi:MAG TPA: PilZ domain-containing protein [Nitrospira sp.]|nr:PilZ domain-containing protein [Nitrospira sp.]
MVLRYGKRVVVACQAIVAGDRSVCDARVLNISLPGCLIECLHRLKVGDYVQVRLFLPDHTSSMHIPLAAVRWANRTRFGLEFIRSSADDQYRLRKFVSKNAFSLGRAKKWKDGITIVAAAGD